MRQTFSAAVRTLFLPQPRCHRLKSLKIGT